MVTRPDEHIPVLERAVIDVLRPEAGQTYVDCTAGLGGHASGVAGRLGPGGRVVLCDLDAGNLERAAARVRGACPEVEIVSVHGSFAALPRRLGDLGIVADLVLADLGFASTQVDDPARGLSFRADGPLDMRLDRSDGPTAAALVNELDEAELADLIWRYGEERHSRRIARKVVAARAESPIETTQRLAEVVRSACPPRRGPGGIDPATRTFQALRIAVNDEIGSLEALLAWIGRGARAGGTGWLGRGARIAVIAFHSLEDRPVKHAFAELAREGLAERLTRKPVMAGAEEVERNPRSRSAKLRAVRLTG